VAVRVEQTVEPSQIVLRGTGTPDQATVTLTLKGPEISGPPLDLMLVLDRSASVELELVKVIARAFVEHLSAEDKVGIVSFADTARLELELTSDTAKALEVIEGLSSGMQTALGDGLMLGITELVERGREDALQLIVLPTDGVSNVGQDPLIQAEQAGSEEIPVYPIAISPAARRAVLSEIARLTGGTFFASFGDDVLEGVLRRMERLLVAHFIYIVQTLPAAILFEDAIENPPIVNRGREVTQLEWRIPLFFQGDLWRTSYQISAAAEGSFSIHRHPSFLQYTDPQGRTVEIDLLALEGVATSITVGRGPGRPEEPEEEPEEPEEEPKRPTGPNKPPTAALEFSPESPLTGEAVKFDASASKDPDGKITKYEWDWTNDNKFDEETEEPVHRHLYGSAGQFTVRLRVTDDRGATADAIVTVEVVEGLRARAAYTDAFKKDPKVPEWMEYYIDDGVVTDEEVRDANARFAADVFIPGTRYRLTSADVTAIIQINQLAKLVEKYQDIKVAEEDGYIKVGNPLPQVGQHYIKEEFLVGPLAFDRPPVLLYAPDAEGKLKLAGVRFISTEKDAVLFQVSDWPERPAAAHFEDGTEQAVSSIERAPLKNAKGSPIVFWHPPLYGLTVWVGIVNPNGLFASLNPEIK
jgi:PKD repeat protein